MDSNRFWLKAIPTRFFEEKGKKKIFPFFLYDWFWEMTDAGV